MNLKSIHVTTYFSIAMSLAMLLLTALGSFLFHTFSLEPTFIREGQYWRLLTANFVHFGWAHTLMNVAALILCTLALLNDTSLKKYLSLIIFCGVAVGLGIYVFDPHYQPYAGFSGVIHGLIIAGLLQTRAYSKWVQIAGLLLVAGKLVQENLPGYTPTDLQQLIPAAVAVESHLYGAIAGFIFALIDNLVQKFKRIT